MKKFILFLALFSAIFLTAVSPGGTGGSASDQADYFYIHPFTTNQNGLFKIAEKLEPRNVFLNVKDVMCMAKNIFFEAAVESTAGKLAVAQVTLNRVRSKNYPNTICDVVYEGRHYSSGLPKRNQCQFSWYCDGRGDEPRESKLWNDSQDLAKYVILRQGDLIDITDGATHYHARYIDAPRWAGQKKITAKIDEHIFYRGRRPSHRL